MRAHGSERGVLSPQKVQAFINRARSSARRRRTAPYASGKNLPSDLDKLGLYDFEEQARAVLACLEEITPEYYKGPHPPNEIACEPVCRGARLLQFVWPSDHFGRRMCFKFALTGSRQADERLVIVRLHDPYDPNEFAKLDR